MHARMTKSQRHLTHRCLSHDNWSEKSFSSEEENISWITVIRKHFYHVDGVCV